MSGLPEAEGGLEELFDETYVALFAPFLSEERSRAEAMAAVRLAGVPPGAEILDCPCGFGRHAFVLAQAGYRVTGADRSEPQLAEAKRRRREAPWPRLVLADYWLARILVPRRRRQRPCGVSSGASTGRRARLRAQSPRRRRPVPADAELGSASRWRPRLA